MKKILIITIILISLAETALTDLKDFHFIPQRKKLLLVEDLYKLYRKNLYSDTAAHIANIYYLNLALKAAETNKWWAHPTKSFAYVKYDWANPPYNKYGEPPFTEKHYLKYKELMKMRISLLLTKSYLKLGSHYDSSNIYWFNIEYYKKRKKSLSIAEKLYKQASIYWEKTKHYVNTCWKMAKIDLKGIEMDQIEDEVYKIYHMSDENYKRNIKNYYNKENYPEFNYNKIITNKIKSIEYKKKKLNNLISRLK